MLPQSTLRLGGRLLMRFAQVRHKRIGPLDPAEPKVPTRKNFKESLLPMDWHKFVDKYPEFLPDPINNSPIIISKFIDDMLARRTVIEIPEFYVGSILSVTVTDPFSDTKRSKFVGLCIERQGQMKFATFTLRNIIDGMGCEIRYELYNPLILNITVLKLEKRLDEELTYLRDALPEYSTVPEDMKPVPHAEDAEVPVNNTLVRMKPHPWSRRWEKRLYKGIEKFENIPEYFAQKVWAIQDNPVYSYDLMMEYRAHCTEEMMYNICRRLAQHEKDVVEPRKAARSRKFLNLAGNMAPRTVDSVAPVKASTN